MGETYTPLRKWNMASMCKNLSGKFEDRKNAQEIKEYNRICTTDKLMATVALSCCGPL